MYSVDSLLKTLAGSGYVNIRESILQHEGFTNTHDKIKRSNVYITQLALKAITK